MVPPSAADGRLGLNSVLKVSDPSIGLLLLAAAVTGTVGAVASALVPSLRRLAVAVARRSANRIRRLASGARSRRTGTTSTSQPSEGVENAHKSEFGRSDDPTRCGTTVELGARDLLEEPEPVSSRGAVAIPVRCDGSPLVGAEVLALFPNESSVAAVTDSAGEASFDLHNMSLSMTVFVAARGCTAYVKAGWTPTDGGFAVDLSQLPDGGSMVIRQGAGHIPGLAGRLNPILDHTGQDLSLRRQHRRQRRRSAASHLHPGCGSVEPRGRERERIPGARDCHQGKIVAHRVPTSSTSRKQLSQATHCDKRPHKPRAQLDANRQVRPRRGLTG